MSEAEAERLPPELQAAMEAEIDSDEELRWCGRPDPGRIVRRVASGVMVLSLMATLLGGMALNVAWTTRAVLIDAGSGYVAGGGEKASWGTVWAMGLLGGTIVAAGVLGGPSLLIAEHRRAKYTVYVVTDTRVFSVMLNRRGLPRTSSVEPGHPLHLNRSHARQGLGDILLYPSRGQQGAAMSLWGIQRPREVERLIRTTFDPPGAPKRSPR